MIGICSSFEATVRVLRMARWIEAQVDAFAGNRAAFRGQG
jgi:hypothetical protein